MGERRQTWRRFWRVLLLALFLAACGKEMAPDQSPPPGRDINAVLADHDKELLAIPGVTGVYVGLRSDARTPCLRVMLIRDTPEVRRAVPKSLEGYAVELEVTGEIRPLDDGG